MSEQIPETRRPIEIYFEEELRQIESTVLSLDCAATKARFGSICKCLIDSMTTAVPGDEWVDTIPMIFDLSACVAAFGFKSGPIMFCTNLKLKAPQPTVDTSIEEDVAILDRPYLGRTLNVPMGTYTLRDGRLIGTRNVISPEQMTEIKRYLALWAGEIDRVPESEFRPQRAVFTDQTVRGFVDYFANEVLRSEAMPAAAVVDSGNNPPDSVIHSQPDQTLPDNRRHPNDMAIFAYRMDVVSQKSQSEIATMIKVRHARDVSQGTVSRWIKEVKEFLGDGGVLPELTKSRLPRAVPVDPAVIDLGRNSSGTTKRQRGRKSEDD